MQKHLFDVSLFNNINLLRNPHRYNELNPLAHKRFLCHTRVFRHVNALNEIIYTLEMTKHVRKRWHNFKMLLPTIKLSEGSPIKRTVSLLRRVKTKTLNGAKGVRTPTCFARASYCCRI